MRRALPGGYELDDDRERIDLDVVCRFLCEESYWALGRDPAVIVASVGGSARVVGLYHEGTQVGFARAISDGAIFALLADVFVLREHRGKGLGVELVRETVENGPLSAVAWGLSTRDAEGLYEKFGFAPQVAPPTIMDRPRQHG